MAKNAVVIDRNLTSPNRHATSVTVGYVEAAFFIAKSLDVGDRKSESDVTLVVNVPIIQKVADISNV
jgi:hypothetical protein